MKEYIKINENDNVIIALSDMVKGDQVENITLLEDIRRGHKIALKDIKANEHIIKYEEASRDDMLKMFEFKAQLNDNIIEKNDTPLTPANAGKKRQYSQSNETAQDNKRDNVELSNNTLTIENIFKTQIADILNEKHIDIVIAQQTFTCLWTHGAQTQQDITNYICATILTLPSGSR